MRAVAVCSTLFLESYPKRIAFPVRGTCVVLCHLRMIHTQTHIHTQMYVNISNIGHIGVSFSINSMCNSRDVLTILTMEIRPPSC